MSKKLFKWQLGGALKKMFLHILISYLFNLLFFTLFWHLISSIYFKISTLVKIFTLFRQCMLLQFMWYISNTLSLDSTRKQDFNAFKLFEKCVKAYILIVSFHMFFVFYIVWRIKVLKVGQIRAMFDFTQVAVEFSLLFYSHQHSDSASTPPPLPCILIMCIISVNHITTFYIILCLFIFLHSQWNYVKHPLNSACCVCVCVCNRMQILCYPNTFCLLGGKESHLNETYT